MNMYDLVSNVYDADLLVSVQDLGSLEKQYGPDDEDEDEDGEFFRRFIKLVTAC
jgi:hypothetical protein